MPTWFPLTTSLPFHYYCPLLKNLLPSPAVLGGRDDNFWLLPHLQKENFNGSSGATETALKSHLNFKDGSFLTKLVLHIEIQFNSRITRILRWP